MIIRIGKVSGLIACLLIGVALLAVPASVAVADTPSSLEIKVLTYNVCGLPDIITKDRRLIKPVKARLGMVADLVRGYDIIGLQEMFVPARSVIEQKLHEHLVARGTDSPLGFPTGSGIYIFAEGKIPRSTFEKWNSLTGPDSLSHKGFVGAAVNLANGLDIDVFDLHAQAGGKPELRQDNYRQLLEGIERFTKNSGRPILVLGDFNCEINTEECDSLFAHSNLKNVNPNTDTVDHILYDENGSGWKISVVSTRFMFDEKVNGLTYSDHLGLEAVLRFER